MIEPKQTVLEKVKACTVPIEGEAPKVTDVIHDLSRGFGLAQVDGGEDIRLCLNVVWEGTYDYGYGEDDYEITGVELLVAYKREETDQEYNRRIEKLRRERLSEEQKEREKLDRKRRAEIEKLRAKADELGFEISPRFV